MSTEKKKKGIERWN